MVVVRQDFSTESDDRTLIDAINDGDEGAFEILYRRYRDWVARLAFRFTANHEDAMDVLQETFAYLLKKTPRLSLTARMTTFLYPVVKNLCLARRRKKWPGLMKEELLDAVAAPQKPASEVEALVAGLPGGQREVLLMRFVDDLSLEEIAGALDIPVGTVKSRLHHAMGTLRERSDLKFR